MTENLSVIISGISDLTVSSKDEINRIFRSQSLQTPAGGLSTRELAPMELVSAALSDMFEKFSVMQPDLPNTHGEVGEWAGQMNTAIDLLNSAFTTRVLSPISQKWFSRLHADDNIFSFVNELQATDPSLANAADLLLSMMLALSKNKIGKSPLSNHKTEFVAMRMKTAYKDVLILLSWIKPNSIIKNKNMYDGQNLSSYITFASAKADMNGVSSEGLAVNGKLPLEHGIMPYFTTQAQATAFVQDVNNTLQGTVNFGDAGTSGVVVQGDYSSYTNTVAFTGLPTANLDLCEWVVAHPFPEEASFSAIFGVRHFLGMTGLGVMAAALLNTNSTLHYQVSVETNGVSSIYSTGSLDINDNDDEAQVTINVSGRFLTTQDRIKVQFVRMAPAVDGDSYQIVAYPGTIQSHVSALNPTNATLQYMSNGVIKTLRVGETYNSLFLTVDDAVVQNTATDFLAYVDDRIHRYLDSFALFVSAWQQLMSRNSTQANSNAKYNTILSGTPSEGMPSFLSSPLSWWVRDGNLPNPGSYDQFYQELTGDLELFHYIVSTNKGAQSSVASLFTL
jgi:hypothetical protein